MLPHTLRHCAHCYTLAGGNAESPTQCENKVFQLSKELTALVASFGIHTTIITCLRLSIVVGHRVRVLCEQKGSDTRSDSVEMTLQ